MKRSVLLLILTFFAAMQVPGQVQAAEPLKPLGLGPASTEEIPTPRTEPSKTLPPKAALAQTSPISFEWNQYLTKNVKGQVLVWEPWASTWHPVTEGSTLWEGTLVQVGYNSSVKILLTAENGFKHLNANTVSIALNNPMIVRLQEEMFRKVNVSSLFIPELPEITVKEPGVLSKIPIFSSINEAWDRFSAVLSRGGSAIKPPRPKDDEEKTDIEMGALSKKLKLLAPTDNSVSVSYKLPSQLTASWVAPEPGLHYRVYMWLETRARPAPLAVTRFDYHVLPVFEEGTYLIQVVSEDGRYQSNPNRVHVVSPFDERIAGLIGNPPRLPLPLLEPPPDFVYVTQVFPQLVSFHWERGRKASDNNQTFELVLSSLEGKELIRRRTKSLMTQLRFTGPGRYRWRVEALAPTDDGTVLRSVSDERNIEIRHLATLAVPDPLGSLFIAKHGLFYLENGL